MGFPLRGAELRTRRLSRHFFSSLSISYRCAHCAKTDPPKHDLRGTIKVNLKIGVIKKKVNAFFKKLSNKALYRC